MDLLLIRHATPVPPVPGHSHEEDDERPLTAAGKADARDMATSLAAEPIVAVYSSPALRALETVQPLATACALDVIVLPELRERRFGPEIIDEASFIEAVARLRADPEYALPGGESTSQVIERAFIGLERIRRDVGGGTVAIASHGGWISTVRWHLGDESSVEQALAMPMPALLRIEHGAEGWRLA